VQAAGEAVGAALALVEFAAGVQAGVHQLNHRCFFFGVHAKGDATPVVLHGDGAVSMDHDLDLFAVAAQGFIGRVVQHFLDDMQRIVGAGIHARALLDGLQALEDPDGAF